MAMQHSRLTSQIGLMLEYKSTARNHLKQMVRKVSGFCEHSAHMVIIM